MPTKLPQFLKKNCWTINIHCWRNCNNEQPTSAILQTRRKKQVCANCCCWRKSVIVDECVFYVPTPEKPDMSTGWQFAQMKDPSLCISLNSHWISCIFSISLFLEYSLNAWDHTLCQQIPKTSNNWWWWWRDQQRDAVMGKKINNNMQWWWRRSTTRWRDGEEDQQTTCSDGEEDQQKLPTWPSDGEEDEQQATKATAAAASSFNKESY